MERRGFLKGLLGIGVAAGTVAVTKAKEKLEAAKAAVVPVKAEEKQEQLVFPDGTNKGFYPYTEPYDDYNSNTVWVNATTSSNSQPYTAYIQYL